MIGLKMGIFVFQPDVLHLSSPKRRHVSSFDEVVLCLGEGRQASPKRTVIPQLYPSSLLHV